MLRVRAIAPFVALAALIGCYPASAAIGSTPARFEELSIGGGIAEAINGGLEIDKSGNVDSTGYLSAVSLKLRQGSYRATISWPTATANRAITFPDAAGEVTLLGQTISLTGEVTGELPDANVSNTLTSSIFIGSGSTTNAVDLATAEVAGNLGLNKISTSGASTDDVLTFDGANVVWAPGGVGSVSLSDITQSGATAGQAIVWGGSSWAATSLGDSHISNTLTASIFVGSGSTTNAVDLATAEVAGTLPAASVGTGLTDAQVSNTLQASLFVGSGSTTSAIDLATAEVAGLLPLANLDASTGTNGDVLTIQDGEWVPAAGGGGTIGGPGPTLDNALPRMNGTGGLTIQGYSSDAITPTVSDGGVVTVPAGAVFGSVSGETSIYTALNMGVVSGDSVSRIKFYKDGNASTDKRWEVGPSNDIESGTLGGTDLTFRRLTNTGSAVGDDVYALRISRDPASGVIIRGPSGTPSPLYVDGNIYNGVSNTQLTSSGKVLLAALEAGGATPGQVMGYNGSTWGPTSSAVNWGSPGQIGSVVPNTGAFTSVAVGTSLTVDDNTTLGSASSDTLTINATGKVVDDTTLSFGTDSDIRFLYDETTDDQTEITDGTNNLAYIKDLGTTGLWGVTGRAEIPQIGIAADTDLLVLASNSLTVNGAITVTTPLTDANVNDAQTISGGTINNSVIGGVTPAAATFTTVTGTTGTWTGAQTVTAGHPGLALRRAANTVGFGQGMDLYLQDSANNYHMYGSVLAAITTNTDGAEEGRVNIYASRAGAAATSIGAVVEFSHSGMLWEGTTNDANETTFTITNPTADRTITFPDSTGTVSLFGSLVDIAEINATGTPGSGNYLRGDGQWATVPGTSNEIIWIPASEMYAVPLQSPTGGTDSGTDTDESLYAVSTIVTSGVPIANWLFPDGTTAAASAQFMVPKNFNNASPNVIVRVYWYPGTVTTGNVEWTVAAISLADDESLATPPAGGNTVIVDAYTAAWDMLVASSGSAVDIWSTNDPNPNEFVTIYVQRNPGNAADTYAGDAHLIGFSLEYTPA